MSFVFFLGGIDAEMHEIRNILIKHNQKLFDKDLSWGAKVSVYKEELENLTKGTPVLIELEIDLPLPENTIIIDHHGPHAGKDKLTSIEQVAALLNIQLNRWQKLIAANDRGWIDEMKKMNATDKEIKILRNFDRYLQGVTEEEEKAAETAITNVRVENGIAIVEYAYPHASPLLDRLYGKYENILAITSKSINFSGDGKIVLKLVEAFPEGWYGGNLPEKGFWGSNNLNLKGNVIEFLNKNLRSI